MFKQTKEYTFKELASMRDKEFFSIYSIAKYSKYCELNFTEEQQEYLDDRLYRLQEKIFNKPNFKY